MMIKETVILGQSLLTMSLGLAWQKRFGGQTERRLRIITDNQNLADYDLTSLYELPAVVEWRRLLPYAEVIIDRVRSVNLPAKRIVGERRSYRFDELIIDFTPHWSVGELTTIGRHWRSLIRHLQADPKLVGKLLVQTPTVIGYQLLLAALNERRESAKLTRQLKAAVIGGVNYLDKFAKEAGAVGPAKVEPLPGLVISHPRPIVNRRRLRGVRLDRSGKVMVDGKFHPTEQTTIKIIDNAKLDFLNSPRSSRWLAERIINDQAVEISPSAVLNDGQRRLKIDSSGHSRGWRALVSYRLDRSVFNLWRRLMEPH